MNRIFNDFDRVAAGLALGSAIANGRRRRTREPPPGQNRYVYLVMADPLPGRKRSSTTATRTCIWAISCSFQLDRGAAFAWCPTSPRNIKPLYRRGNRSSGIRKGPTRKLQSEALAAIAGGKSRHFGLTIRKAARSACIR